LRFVLAPILAALGASNPPAQNLLIVTVMSFDRAGNIKHNHHVQTRADFPPTSARHARADSVLRLR
jgi:hypothetical protein